MTLPVLTPGAEVVAKFPGGVTVRGPLDIAWMPDLGATWWIGTVLVARADADSAGRVCATSLRLAADVDAEARGAVLDEVFAAVYGLPSWRDAGTGAIVVEVERVHDAIVGLSQASR